MRAAVPSAQLRGPATKAVGLIELWRNSTQRRFERDVLEGLSAEAKRIPAQYLYDERGVQLARLILETPEHYVARVEREIVLRHARELLVALPAGACDVIDLAPEDGLRARMLLERFHDSDVRYVPIAPSARTLREAARSGAHALPWLPMFPVRAEGVAAVAHLAALDPSRRRLVLWMGSQIGQLERPAALELLRGLREALRPSDRLLISFDLRKDPALLEAAYRDDAGLNAELDSNLLLRINRELHGQFRSQDFTHNVRFSEERQAVLCELISRRPQSVRVGHFRHDFRAHEPIQVRLACKYCSSELHGFARRAGFDERARFADERSSLLVAAWSVPLSDAASV
jgi:L-histidine N-alpha-methyltransferase